MNAWHLGLWMISCDYWNSSENISTYLNESAQQNMFQL